MKETISIYKLSSGAFAVELKFLIKGSYVRTCDISGSFCIDDYGDFPPSIAHLLLDSEVRVYLFTKLSNNQLDSKFSIDDSASKRVFAFIIRLALFLSLQQEVNGGKITGEHYPPLHYQLSLLHVSNT